MKQIQRGKLGEFIAAAFGLRGRSSPMLDEQIVGTYEPDVMDRGPWRQPVACATGVLLKASVVGNIGVIGVRPNDNTSIVVLREVLVPNLTGGAITWVFGRRRPTYNPLAVVNTVFTQMLHRPGVGGPCEAYTGHDPAPQQTSIIGYWQQPVNVFDRWQPNVPIACSRLPGWDYDEITIQASAANTQIVAGFIVDVYQAP